MCIRDRGKGKVEAPAQGRGWGEFTGVALLALGILTLGGLFSYQTGATAWMGPVGHLLAGALYASFGMAAYLVALGVIAMGVQSLLGRGIDLTLSDAVGFTIATIAGCVLLHVSFPHYRVHGYTAGGLGGELVGEVSLGLFHRAGTYLIAGTVMCIGLIASTPLSASHLVALGRTVARGCTSLGRYLFDGAMALLRSAAQDEGAPLSLIHISAPTRPY